MAEIRFYHFGDLLLSVTGALPTAHLVLFTLTNFCVQKFDKKLLFAFGTKTVRLLKRASVLTRANTAC